MNLGKLGQAFTAREIFQLIQDDLVLVEEKLSVESVASVDAVTAIGQYLQSSGGKRLRPALLLLSSKLVGGSASASAIQLGAVVEMIHAATLVHDDVIDAAETRRGRPSSNVKWGNHTCVLAGDWLYMQAFKIAVQERNFRILDTLIELTQQMVEGELLQMEKLGKLISLDEHFDLIYRKTACLFSVCMRLGGILGGATPQQEDNLGQYGRNLGMAFQIVDDVLDLTATQDVLGKPVASDLREGKVTMAVIHALEHGTGQERSQIETVLLDRAFNGVTHRQILDILHRYGSIDFAYTEASRYAEAARQAICTFPNSEIKRALLWAPDFVVAREK
jgi:octaprenyl-diphosphate synthase